MTDISLLPYTKGISGWERVESATKSGLVFGAVIGAVRGNWDFNIVAHETSLGALSKSATTMGATMLIFGGVAMTYAAVEAGMEALRGQADWRNGAVAGLAAGSVIGIRSGKLGTAVGAGMMFSLASAAVDLSSGQMRANIFNVDPKPTNPHASQLKLQKY